MKLNLSVREPRFSNLSYSGGHERELQASSHFEHANNESFDMNDVENEMADPNEAEPSRLVRLRRQIFPVIKSIFSSSVYSVAIFVGTIFALFGSQLRVIFFSNAIDPTFNVLFSICFLIFILEILFRTVVDSSYFLGFYFFIDLTSSVLLIFEMPVVYYNTFFDSSTHSQYYLLIKLIRILQSLRLVRILKLMKKIIDRGQSQSVVAKGKAKESMITTIIKESNMKKLIILILTIVIAIPFLDLNVYIDTTPSSLDCKSMSLFPRFVTPGVNRTEVVQDSIFLFRNNSQDLIYVRVDDFVFDTGVFAGLRYDEYERFSGLIGYANVQHLFDIIVSNRYKRIIEEVLVLCKTLVVTVIMIASIVSLNKDMSNLILNPLERMIQKVKAVSRNPIQAIKQKSQGIEKREMNETLIIEQAISKISQLLVLGFGQAGSRIISHLLLDSGQDIDQNVPGERTRAVFGFCDIRQFTDATEVLLEDVMVFVNSIAEIVHHSVDNFGGAANKNIGDAFLLVWKLYSENTTTQSFAELSHQFGSSQKDEVLSLIRNQNSRTAELALLSFVQIIVNLSLVPSIKQYSENEKLTKRIPGYKVKMGFGLHEGWAIEGAIGSRYKIDASYLSPNVNLASRLEAATKQFGVNILFSGQIYNMFTTHKLRNFCRHIDTVRVKGSIQPMRLYTIDLNIAGLERWVQPSSVHKKLQSIKMDKSISLQEAFRKMSRQILTSDFNDADFATTSRVKSFEEESQVIATLLKPEFNAILSFPETSMTDFRIFFTFAVDAYIAGTWALAKMHLSKCLKLKPNDGPSTVLFEYMEGFNFDAPITWDRSRELTEK